MGQADDLREKIYREYIVPARERGDAKVEVRAGDIQSFNLPNVCQAMSGKKIEDKYGVKIIYIRDNQGRFGNESRPSTSYWVTYDLSGHSDSQVNYERDLNPIPDNNEFIHTNENQNIKNNSNHLRTNNSSMEEKLKVLKILKDYKDDGIITEEEFESKKKEILETLVK